MYPDEIPAYQFDSEGSMNVDLYEKEDLGGDGEVIEIQTCNECGSEMKEGECTECGSSMYEDVDEDLRESFISQKNEIKEMFNRFNKFN
jgi:RecJ-like exonuclease